MFVLVCLLAVYVLLSPARVKHASENNAAATNSYLLPLSIPPPPLYPLSPWNYLHVLSGKVYHPACTLRVSPPPPPAQVVAAVKRTTEGGCLRDRGRSQSPDQLTV